MTMRRFIDLVELDISGIGNKPPPKAPPRQGNPWGDDPENFDEYTFFWIRGPLIVRCKLGTPEEDFFSRRDALHNYDVWNDPALTGITNFDMDDDASSNLIFGTALSYNFVMIHVDWHETTPHADANQHDKRDIRRYLQNATTTSGYDLNVISKDETIAKHAAKLLVSKYGDLPAKIVLSLHQNGKRQKRVVDVRSFLS